MMLFTRPILAIAVNWGDIINYVSPSQTSSIDQLAMPKALNVMWGYALNGNMYKLTAGLGMLAAVCGVGFWCVKFYRALHESTLLPAVNGMIWPLLIVLLLANGGANMRSLTMTAREAINNINTSVYRVVDLDVDYQTALKVLMISHEDRAFMDYLSDQCNSNIDQSKVADCVARVRSLINARLAGRISPVQSASSPEMVEAVRKFENNSMEAMRRTEERSKQVIAQGAVEKTATQSTQPSGSTTPQAASTAITDVFSINSNNYSKSKSEATTTILSLRRSFLYLVEVMMLVVGLFGPVFLGLSMFPVGTKPLIAWGGLFLAIGFCKISYSLISGLSAVAMVLSGPESSDMLVVAVVIGGLSPILSIAVSGVLSSSLTSVVNSTAYSAQGYGLNAGLTFGAPPGLPPTPETTKVQSPSNKR